MEEEGLVLNLHGEVPSDRKDITVMNAEASFLPTLQDLHRRFPKLRIVLGASCLYEYFSVLCLFCIRHFPICL